MTVSRSLYAGRSARRPESGRCVSEHAASPNNQGDRHHREDQGCEHPAERRLEGGADADRVYTFAFVHYVAIGALVRF
jgi:hypothetical protein